MGLHTTLAIQARSALQMTQRELADAVGTSTRTVVRWEGGKSSLDHIVAPKIARLLYPVDRDLAARVLALNGATLASAGLEVPASPPPDGASAASSARGAGPRVSLAPLLDSVVCAMADAANRPPKAVRASVLLVLRKAAEVGLDLEAAATAGLLEEDGTGGGEPPAW